MENGTQLKHGGFDKITNPHCLPPIWDSSTQMKKINGRRGSNAPIGRRLSKQNDRKVVDYLRRRLSSLREKRIIIVIEDSDSDQQTKTDSGVEKNTMSTMSIDMNNNKDSSLLLKSFIGDRPYSRTYYGRSPHSDSRIILPSIVVNEHDASLAAEESDRESIKSRMTSTPGIFVDWKSEDENDVIKSATSDNELSEYTYLGNNITTTRTKENSSDSTTSEEFCSYLMGDVGKGIRIKRKKVKIFISGGGNTNIERKLLLTSVFPRLAQLSRSNGLSFEVVDLCNRGGESDSQEGNDSNLVHVKDCFEAGLGPSFVSFLTKECCDSWALPIVIPRDVMERMNALIDLEIVAIEANIYVLSKASSLSISSPKQVRFAEENLFLDEEVPLDRDVTGLKHLRKRIRHCQKNKRMLKRSYDIDRNAVPSNFVLKIESDRNYRSIIFLCFDFQTNLRRASEVSDSSSTLNSKLIAVFKECEVKMNLTENLTSWTRTAFHATTGKEILTALAKSNDPKSNCLWFCRSFTKTKSKMTSSKINDDIKRHENLQRILNTKIGLDNVREYILPPNSIQKLTQGNPIQLEGTKNVYTEKLDFDMYNSISLQLKRALEETCQNGEKEERYLDDDIVTEHVHFLQQNWDMCIGREETLDEIKKYVISDCERVPLAVCGEAGCGKTTILCRAAKRTKYWIKSRASLSEIRYQRYTRRTVVIFRSVGVTSESRVTKSLLYNICQQLRFIAKTLCVEEENEDGNDVSTKESIKIPEVTQGKVQTLSDTLKKLLVAITKTKTIVVIFIDNFSASSGERGSYSLSWLPKPLPKNVKIVMSFTHADDKNQCSLIPKDMYDAYMKLYKEKSKLLFVPNLSFKQTLFTEESKQPTRASEVLTFLLSQNRRTINPKQRTCILKTAFQCPSPLGIKLLTEIAKTWKSFQSEQFCIDSMKGWGGNIREFVCKYLDVVCNRHEKYLFKAVTCFITCSRHGLTHQEIIDLLSRDKEVAKEILGCASTPGTPKVAKPSKKNPKKSIKPENLAPSTPNRCSSVCDLTTMWYKLHGDLKPFLLETLSDDVMTVKWRHCVFADQVDATYMSSKEDSFHYHDIMTSYFSNESVLCCCGFMHECGQPLQWRTSSKTTYNLRRLNESIFHAMKSRDVDSVKRNMLFDFNWLQAKLTATSIETLTDDFRDVLELKPNDQDVKLLAEALFLSRDTLRHDPSQLPSQLIGRLHDVIEQDVPLAPEDPRRYPFTRTLVYQIRRIRIPFLLPTKTCLTSGKQVIFDPLNGHDDVITSLTSCTDGQRIVTASRDSTIKIWDIISRRVLRTIENVGKDVSSMCVCMGNYYVATLHKHNQVKVWSLLKCSRVYMIKEYPHEDRIHLTTAADGQLLAICSQNSLTMRVWDLDKLSFHREINLSPEFGRCKSLSVARNSRGNNAFVGYLGHTDAVVVNAKRGKIVRTLTCKDGRITQVESSREYYIIGCRQREMEFHELQHFYLHDSINYGLVRVIKACADDTVFDIFVNRLGSHLIGLSANTSGEDEIVVWSMDSDAHRHMVRSKTRFIGGTCIDLQYCMTASESESVVRIHNLGAHNSRTQVKKRVDGIGRLFNMPRNEKYVVAQGTSGSPITIWNVARSRCRGKAVIVERGLLDKNDVVVVKDVLVVILSDRGMVFETIYVYNLMLRKYERKLHPVQINICPVDHYHVIGSDRLIATSNDRVNLIVWSIVTGQILYNLQPDFSSYQIKETETKKKSRNRRRIRKQSQHLPQQNDVTKKKTTWKRCHVTAEERKQVIFEIVVSGNEKTLLCSYYSRHLVVFNLETRTHVHTLSDRHSLLQLHKSIITSSGSFLLNTNYDNVTHCTYITLWDLKDGCVSRRRRNEPKVCALDITEDASRVVFATEDIMIKIWDPFRRRSHRSIPGYQGLEMMTPEKDDSQPTTIFIVNGGRRAILFANSISVWDLEAENLLMVFTPDAKFQCCTVALRGQVIVVGMRDTNSITTLRMTSSLADGEMKCFGKDRFGEDKASSSDDSSDEIDDNVI